MMNAKEIANIWKEVVKIYNNTRENNLPEKTMEEIIRKFGLEKTKEVFATGSINAAIFLAGKPAGLYDMSDLINE